MSERVSDPFDTLVIGGGIAGLTAALFATRSGCSTLVLVPGIPGGQPSPAERATETSSEDAHAQGETPRMSWARLLKRVFDIDLEHCPNCGGALKIIAAIEDPPVIVKILTHLGLPSRVPPRFPARPLDFIPDNLTAENCLPTKPTMPFALTWTEWHDNATLRARPVRFRPSRPVQERVFHPSKKI
jgi:hypothetical protein